MPPRKDWDDDSSDEDSSTGPEAAPQVLASRRKFDDEEGEDSDVLDSWDAAEDSEEERKKAAKVAEAKANAEAAAKASKKSHAERIAQLQAQRKAAKEAAEAESTDDETEQEKRDRLRRAQKEADLKHAQELFEVGAIGGRKGNTAAAAVIVDPSNPNNTVDLSSLPLFNPKTKTQLENMGKTIAPLIAQHHKMPYYVAFLQDVLKGITKELPSGQVKKLASTLTAVSNEKMKVEKAQEKTGKKKGKSKTTLVMARDSTAEDAQVATAAADDGLGDDDFM